MLTDRDVRKIRCLDGLHYSFRLLEFYHTGLWDTCCKISEENSFVVRALAACWGFIDALHRVREIAQSIPDLSSKHQEMRAFLDATLLAEEYRHYIQHLRGELSKKEQNPFPVWGSLSWVDKANPNLTHTAVLGARTSGTHYTSCVYDTVERKWVSNVCLGINEKSFNFDSAFSAAQRFEKFVLAFLLEGAPKEIQLHEELAIISAEFSIIDGA